MEQNSPSKGKSHNLSLRAIRVAAIYTLFGLLWIFFSDQFLLLFTDDANYLAQLQTVKGWFFIGLTAVLLFILVRQNLVALEAGYTSLRQSEHHVRTLLDTIPDLIWLKDAEGVYLSCNATFERFFGAKQNEIIGKTDYDFVDNEQAVFFRENDLRAMEAGKPCNNEEWITFADSGYRALLLTTKMPMHDSEGNVIGVLGVGRDITELRQAEKDKIKLEHQLQQAQKIESIGQLAGGVAHDFNNMLGVILGQTELALMKADRDNPFVDDLKAIQNAAKRSADLTRQLLTFARKETVTPKMLDLNDAVAGLLSILQRLIGENIHLSWNPEPNLWTVKIDPAQLDQILANLCVNARDAIENTGTITLETQNCFIAEGKPRVDPEVQPGDYVRLSVSDDGQGMDLDHLQQIFEPFFTTKEVGEGTGLGLATVFGAIKQNNGFIEVTSEPGEGATFHIYLPRQQTVAKTEQETTVQPLSQGDETILVVEDDQMLLNLVQSMLEKCGYTILASSSIDEAIALAKDHPDPIHLLLSDLIMPQMNGRELRDRLLGIRPKLKVIFMSGYTADIIAQQGVMEEGVNFLQKPVSYENLTAKVRHVLDQG